MGFNIMSIFDPGGKALGMYDGPPDYAGSAKKQEKARQALITQGTGNINSAFGGFDQNFYDQRAQAYYNYAIPQLSKQYTGMKNAMGFGLANRGLLGSGSAQNQYSNLNQEMSLQKQAIADAGVGQAQGLQKEIEGQRNVLLGQLYETANPTLAGQTATATAAGFSAPSIYAPLGNMFSNLMTQYYARQLLNGYNPQGALPVQQQGSPAGVNTGAMGPTTLQGGK